MTPKRYDLEDDEITCRATMVPWSNGDYILYTDALAWAREAYVKGALSPEFPTRADAEARALKEYPE